MNNAGTYPIGNHKKPRNRKTNETAPQVGGVRRVDAKTKGCTGNFEGQKKVRTDSHATNGILRTSFLPKFRESESMQALGKSTKLERDFSESLSGLTEHYAIEPFTIEKFEFPYNVNLALSHTKEQLKKSVVHWDKLRLIKDSNRVYLVTEERYDTGTTLFYIPVFPLFKMLNDRKYKKAAHLMLSVFSYLYHIADIPYYTQENSYLYWQYEMLQDWILDDSYTEDDEEDHRMDEISMAEWVGKKMERKICNMNNLIFFEERLKTFRPNDQFDENCLVMARKVLALYRSYPQENIFRYASSIIDETGEDVDDEIIPMEKYISFYADNKGWLASTLYETVNNEFQECCEMQQPVILKYFDGRHFESIDLSFETRLFDLLHDIIDLLNDYRNLSNEKY